MKIIEVFKVYWSGSTLTPFKKNFIADMDELEHAKKIKKVVKMSTFWDDPPPVVKIHNFFFFRMNPSLRMLEKQPYQIGSM